MSQLSTSDSRNVIDKYKGVPNAQIVEDLDKSRIPLQIAIENLEHDFNMGTVVRNANAFNVSHVHIIGKKHYNRRGAMCTDKYLHIHHWESSENFIKTGEATALYNEVIKFWRDSGLTIYAIENTKDSKPLGSIGFDKKAVFIFGSENNGISKELLNAADEIVAIEQFGSTRSINVGVASGITMYEYVRQNVLN